MNLTEQQEQEFLDQMDRQINKTPLVCGHKPCTLGHCKGCEKHCQPRKDLQWFIIK